MTIDELKKGEHETVEYKQDIPKDKEKYLKTAVAFANGAGGRLIFGVENNTWNVIGYSDDEVFQKYDTIASSIYDACIREMISNAVCHRSYLSPGSIQVAIYDDRLEVTSPGRLSPDLTTEQMIAGNSRVRNVAIGAAFQYMHIIEKWGTGIPRIFKEAAGYGLKEPELKDFGTSFRINIFRRPFETDPFGVVNPATETTEGQKEPLRDNAPPNDPQNVPQNVSQSKDRLAEAILDAIRVNPHVTRAEMAFQSGVSIKTISRKLKDMPFVRHVGSSKAGRWEIDF